MTVGRGGTTTARRPISRYAADGQGRAVNGWCAAEARRSVSAGEGLDDVGTTADRTDRQVERVSNVGATVFPYNSCVEVETIGWVIAAFFDICDPEVRECDATEQILELPLAESDRAGTTAVRLGPLPILADDGTTHTEEALLAFFPGEPAAVFVEHPIQDRTDDEMLAIADAAVDRVVGALVDEQG